MSAVSNISRPCSNPGCPEVGNFKKCVKCESVFYHSRDCQREHWRNGHKEACADLTKKKIEDVTARANSSTAKAEDLKNKSAELRKESTKSIKAMVSSALNVSVRNQNPQIAANSSVSLSKVENHDFSVVRLHISSPGLKQMEMHEKMAWLGSMAANIKRSFKCETEADETDQKAEKAKEKVERAKEKAERLKANLNASSTTSSQSKPAGSTNVANDCDVD